MLDEGVDGAAEGFEILSEVKAVGKAVEQGAAYAGKFFKAASVGLAVHEAIQNVKQEGCIK